MITEIIADTHSFRQKCRNRDGGFDVRKHADYDSKYLMERRIEIVVGIEGHKKRLDEYLFAHFGGLSKMYLRHAVKREKCEVNGRIENVGYRLRANDLIELELDLSRETAMRPQNIPIDLVYEDEDLIVVNKAAGMLVHPTNRDKSGTLLNALAYHLNMRGNARESNRFNDPDTRFPSSQVSGLVRPGLIHRLDKQTSGLIAIAKTSRAHKRMMDSFRRKLIDKSYLALVEGLVAENEGVIDQPIGRYGELKHWDVKLDGKHSETRFKVFKRNEETTLLELEPVTGRTNQLRIHCSFIGHPIVGDVKRGGRDFYRMCLHAWKITFPHPSTKNKIELTCDPDDAFGHDAALIPQSSTMRS